MSVEEEGRPASLIELDPTGQRNIIVSAFGEKGSGKSTFNRRLYRAFDGPKLCIDVNGNADPGPDALRIHTLDERMPRWKNGERPPNLHYVVDPIKFETGKEYREHLDEAIQMALFPRDVVKLIWIGEYSDAGNANQTGRFQRALLRQSRHYQTNALIDDPRPAIINPLAVNQADYVAVFDGLSAEDRKRIAKNINMEPDDFDEECAEVHGRGPFHHLLYDKKAKTLYRCPPV